MLKVTKKFTQWVTPGTAEAGETTFFNPTVDRDGSWTYDNVREQRAYFSLSTGENRVHKEFVRSNGCTHTEYAHETKVVEVFSQFSMTNKEFHAYCEGLTPDQIKALFI